MRFSMVLTLTVALTLFASGAVMAQSGHQETVSRIATMRAGLMSTRIGLAERDDLFDSAANGLMPQRADRRFLRQAWVAALDYIIAFDNLNEELFEGYREAGWKKRRATFRIAYASYLAQYRLTLDLIDLLERNPAVHKLLNEEIPELGLPSGTYSRVKLRFLNVIRGVDFARLELVYSFYGPDSTLLLTAGLDADRKALWQAGYGKGPKRTAENALRIIQDATASGWFPVQKGVAEWMGDTKVWRPETNLIGPELIASLQQRLEPGDILLVRREWYLSNIGLPGYWPHAALYVGTPEERQSYFDEIAVRSWVQSKNIQSGDFEQLLKRQTPIVYARSQLLQDDDHVPKVIEAISEGVSLTTLEHSAAGDSLVVLRPNLPKVVKARAIERAFDYSGRPYDFEFDFRTDSALVCTELIYKGYESDNGLPGLSLPVIEVLNRPVVPANEIARLFDAEYDSAERQLELIAFLDGKERKGYAEWAGLKSFRQSWQRPKWHLLLKEKR